MKTLTTYLAAALLLFTINSCSDDSTQPPKSSDLQAIQLYHDSYTSNASKVFQGGFVPEEEAAVTLGPLDKELTIRNVQFLFGGGDPEDRTVTLKIYEDDGTEVPGQLIHTSSHLITPADNTFRQLNLTSYGLKIGANKMFRVALEMSKAGMPSIARDDDGSIEAGKNWIRSSDGTWQKAEDLGLTGDFIIRSEVVVEK